MTERYDHKSIEAKWQEAWEKEKAFCMKEDSSIEKYYVLEMFPYPSGRIHMGHVRNYSIGDVIARFSMMKGKNVLHPMGWDSFGLPAENAAIQNGTPPSRWTHENIANMKKQLKRMGLSYDWAREVTTCQPDYYRWNQWIFLKLYEKGLAYKKFSKVNWCTGCSTVLANEQVEDGLCWRCASIVQIKELEQWFLKITAYADELLDFTHKLAGWPEKVLIMQRNWIGKSTGAEVSFPVDGSAEAIKIFTTRPDTIFGVTFMSIATEHPMAEKITTADRLAQVRSFIEKARSEKKERGTAEVAVKEGVFTGAYCVNPVSQAKVPVYVANFVLMEYGTGAVMAVPAHDQRDFEFARVHGLPVRVVINPTGATLDPNIMTEAFADEGVMIDSGEFSGMKSIDGISAVAGYIEKKGLGKKAVNYRLRDWGISRQRYWGCPIPVIYCEDCKAVPVPEKDLPVILPEDVALTGKGLSPLAGAAEFVNVKCPKCGKNARRETDTMDTFVDSSWYFLRYASPKETTLPFLKSDADYCLPVDQYIGGIEHAVMHLLYARFFTKALRDLGLHSFDEPFKNLLTQGMVCKEILKCSEHGYLLPEEVDNGKCAHCARPVETGAVEKMSKSKKNIIDPDGIIEKYGADTTRLFSLFAAPPEKDLDWNEDGVEGSYRFLSRVWRLVDENTATLLSASVYAPEKDGPLDGVLKELHGQTHRTIKKVTADIGERFHFNTAISSIMELVNALYQLQNAGVAPSEIKSRVFKEAVQAVVLMMSPFAPHVSEELWKKLGHDTPVFKTSWPVFNEASTVADEALIVVQINGKIRSRINAPAGSSEEAVRGLVMSDEKTMQWTTGKQIKKFVYVQDKIVNMVVV